MPFTPPKTSKPPKISQGVFNNWLKGVVTAFDGGRTPIDGLLNASNVLLYQDGTVGPRPSLSEYGPQPLGKVLGQVFEYKEQTANGSEFRMCCLQHVNGETGFYTADGDDSTWTRIGSEVYDNTAPGHYLQIQNKVLVMNGVDTLSYFDIETDAIVTYTALTKPTIPTLDSKTSSLNGTSFKVYYAVTANSTVGETEGSDSLSVQVGKDRNTWDSANDSVTIKWSAVTGAQSYNIYAGITADGAGTPTLYRIATTLDPSIREFKDTGINPQDLMNPLPKTNSTAGPKVKRGTEIGGRAWLVGDKDNPFYVWRGGDYGHELDFSPANGGGYTPIGSGTKELPVDIKQFRDGQGNPKITVLTQNSNGLGGRYLLSSREVTYRNSTFIVWESQLDTGNDGTDSPDGVVVYNNSLFYPSRDGFKTTGTRPQLQNVLSTDRVSNTIQDEISRLNTKAMAGAVGVAYEGAIYWALPVGMNRNNEIWVLDMNREGAWMKPLTIYADWLWLYNDNNGRTHFLVLQGNKIYEFNKLQRTNDDGAAFSTSGSSGQLTFSESGREWARLIKVVFRLSRPQGRINLSVSGYTEDGVRTWTNSEYYGVSTTVAGWGEPSVRGIEGFGRHAWSGTETPPVASGQATRDIEVEVDEDVQWWSFAWTSVGTGVNYQISQVTPEYVNIGLKDE